MVEAVLVSGATGFLGSAVIEDLVVSTNVVVYALVRARGNRTPFQRLESLWCDNPVLHDALGSRVVPLEGDIERSRLGLDPDAYEKLAEKISGIVHTAAEVGVNQTRDRFWNVNVRGTYHMLEFARHARKSGSFARFVHVSTAYVAGRREGLIPETLFPDCSYNSLYEWSKFEAELLVSAYDDVPYAIVRPAQIVGDSRDGFVATFNTLYYPLKLYMKGKLRVIPASSDLRVNMVTVDYVANLIRKALFDKRAENAVLHAVTPASRQPTLGQLVDVVRAWASANLHVSLPKPIYVPLRGLAAIGRRRNVRIEHVPKRKGLLRNMAALSPYFFENRLFSTENARTVAGACPPDWRDYLPHLLEYATRRGFLNHTGRTVYEQMLVRLRSGASTRIDYFDVRADGIRKCSGDEARHDILLIVRALQALGVTSGDRVATIGVNSVRYFELDAAIGLVGAVNVPVYYTSPTGDVYDLVKTAGARVLFAGTDRMLDELDLDKLEATVVAMNNRLDVRAGIVSWNAFVNEAMCVEPASVDGVPKGLIAGAAKPTAAAAPDRRIVSGATASPPAKAEPAKAEPENAEPAKIELTKAEAASPCAASDLPWVSPSQTATIRFTSGTTGVPKGVVFDQSQVRWMGEVMPAVLDWRTRNSHKVRYLSFLPMSHVVEGILVAYAPYYILADIEMYYLNDFPSLADVLPKVRPNLFFSVPRFYEKVWNQFAATDAGRFWIALDDGPLKRALAIPLRFAVLRRAGLDRCRQLIVGSAPIGVELLEAFRSLGVEIHNAFGVTEAPLITLSRLGENELGSVGALLPDTEARIGDDGQVYIRGPQVTRGYDGMDEPALDGDGWFCTGDMGAFSPKGNLVLNGRKKEILVTSYGKNIAPQKIEVLLKGIDGVAEAMVIADARPFTTALLWLDDDTPEPFDFGELDSAVRAVNGQLSHPEQVKRWIVAAEPLVVSNGELTPNLKVRRNVVGETRADLVKALYTGWGESPAGAVHWGEAS